MPANTCASGGSATASGHNGSGPWQLTAVLSGPDTDTVLAGGALQPAGAGWHIAGSPEDPSSTPD